MEWLCVVCEIVVRQQPLNYRHIKQESRSPPKRTNGLMKGGSGTTRNRTGDTRIFSPLLYQLSYGTFSSLFAVAKVYIFFHITKLFSEKIRQFIKNHYLCVHKTQVNRDVAQLVAHYVRDVGVGRSSRLIPTHDVKKRGFLVSLFLFFVGLLCVRNVA